MGAIRFIIFEPLATTKCVTSFAHANNHFGGHAPATVRQFRELWRAKGLPALPEPRRIRRVASLPLFDEPV